MRRIKHLFRLILCLFCMLLTSCSLFDMLGTSEDKTPIVLGEYAGQRINLSMVSRASGIIPLASTGNQKILVIPVCFSDFTLSKLNLNNNIVKSNLNKAFFGEAEETGWESVSSFYDKSSYGKLKIEGKVSDVITLSYKLSDVVNHFSDESYYDSSYMVVEQACVKYKENNSDYLDFDQDKDGYLDGVWIVYLNPYLDPDTLSWYQANDKNFISNDYTYSAQNLLWAYTYWDFDTSRNTMSPNPFAYCFGSYEFLWDKEYLSDNKTKLVDAHTFIHETGHLLGLDDYYSYDEHEYIYSPVGSIDMMDNNVGDHNSYSKYLLDWISPKIIKEAGRYTLNSFQLNGEALLVPANINSFNDSPFNEYLLLEFYTPDGLNYGDSKEKYANDIILPNQCGVKIYHVDSRLGLYKYSIFTSSYRFTSFSDTYYNTNDKFVKIVSSNTPSYSDSGDLLINLLSASNNAKKGYVYSNRLNGNAIYLDLFTESSKISKFLFNSALYLDYEITFENMTSTSIDVVFTMI